MAHRVGIEFGEQRGAEAEAALELHMRAAVRQPDDRIRVNQDRRHRRFIEMDLAVQGPGLEVLLDNEVESASITPSSRICSICPTVLPLKSSRPVSPSAWSVLVARLSKSAIDVTNQVGIDRNSAATVEEVGAEM